MILSLLPTQTFPYLRPLSLGMVRTRRLLWEVPSHLHLPQSRRNRFPLHLWRTSFLPRRLHWRRREGLRPPPRSLRRYGAWEGGCAQTTPKKKERSFLLPLLPLCLVGQG
jgi:hypothetical protein